MGQNDPKSYFQYLQFKGGKPNKNLANFGTIWAQIWRTKYKKLGKIPKMVQKWVKMTQNQIFRIFWIQGGIGGWYPPKIWQILRLSKLKFGEKNGKMGQILKKWSKNGSK